MRLVGGDVFDGERWHSGAEVLVDGDRVRALVPAGPADGSGPGAPRGEDAGQPAVDLTGHFVVPGLIDAHLHLFPGFLARLPAFGITGAVDMFATPRLLATLRAEASRPTAARFVSAGTGAAPTGGHPHQLSEQGMYDPFPPLDRPDQVAGFLAAHAEEGAEFVKVFLEDGTAAGRHLPLLDDPTLDRLVRGAHDRGLTVVAHATSTDAALRAVRAGVDGLAHLPVPARRTGGDRAWVESADAVVDALATSGTFVVGTLVSLASLLGQDGTDARLTVETRQRLGAGWRDHLELRAGPRDDAAWDAVLALAARVVAAGVPLLAGTDAAFPGVPPGAALHAELTLLQEVGMSADEALRSATTGPAAHLGPRDCGRLVVGGRADLVILGSDPRREAAASQNLVATMVGGQLLTWDRHRQSA